MKYTLTIQADQPDQLISILNNLPNVSQGILAGETILTQPVTVEPDVTPEAKPTMS